MSKSWNFDPKNRNGQDGGRKKKPRPSEPKSVARRQERALKTGDVETFYEEHDDFDNFDPDRY